MTGHITVLHLCPNTHEEQKVTSKAECIKRRYCTTTAREVLPETNIGLAEAVPSGDRIGRRYAENAMTKRFIAGIISAPVSAAGVDHAAPLSGHLFRAEDGPWGSGAMAEKELDFAREAGLFVLARNIHVVVLTNWESSQCD